MKRLRLLAAVFAGTLCYALVAIFVGRDGLWARKQLENQKRILSVHEASVERINNELLMEKAALLHDKSVIGSYARKLGYVSEGEVLVKIKGISAGHDAIRETGSTRDAEEVRYVSEQTCKSIGFIVFILVYAVLILSDLVHGKISMPVKRNKFRVINGAAIYDIQ